MRVVTHAKQRPESDHAFRADGGNGHLVPGRHFSDQREHAAVREIHAADRITDSGERTPDSQLDVIRRVQQCLAGFGGQLQQKVVRRLATPARISGAVDDGRPRGVSVTGGSAASGGDSGHVGRTVARRTTSSRVSVPAASLAVSTALYQRHGSTTVATALDYAVLSVA